MISQNNTAQPLQQLLAFYTDAGVAFPDVDAEALAAAIEGVNDAKGAVHKSEELLEDAKAMLASQERSLAKLAKKALEYARIYATDDDAWKSRVDAIELKAKVRRARKVKKKKELVLTAAKQTQADDIAA